MYFINVYFCLENLSVAETAALGIVRSPQFPTIDFILTPVTANVF